MTTALPKRRPAITPWKATFLVLAIATSGNAQGFGGGKCEIQIERLRPPAVMMLGPIDVSVNLGRNVNEVMAGDAKGQIEAMLRAGDPSLNRAGGPVRTRIEVSTDLKTLIQARTRQVPTTRTRTITVYNPQTKQEEQQIVEEVVQVDTSYSTVDGQLSILWTAREPVTRQLLLSDETNVFSSHDDFYPEQNSLRDAEIVIINQLSDLVAETAIKSIASRLEPKAEKLTVSISKIRSDMGCKLAKAQEWQDALGFFEKLTPSSNQKDDSYRIYDIGASEEALAYEAGARQDFQASLDHLNRAAQRISEALMHNPGEKVFAAAGMRIEVSHDYYTALEKHKSDNDRIAQPSPAERSRLRRQ
jgi:hypothetical protein